MALHIVFVEPEIPPNTGNIARTCAATDTVLHLVEPLGFSLDEKALRRAGLDYWQHVKVEVHPSLDAFMADYGNTADDDVKVGQEDERNVDGKAHRLFLATTKGGSIYTDMKYQDEDMFLFGKETAGLPRPFINAHYDRAIRIPMSASTRLRSFNLSNSANIILFEALRQLDFPGLE
ncbi:MAG: tRNA (cytidine(34)-2'-O)-methyltransferase [Clostridia bacterium]|nr:tRNA (cytidine(34)-2'-O)-methyltransferase [Clostridia bacterium]